MSNLQKSKVVVKTIKDFEKVWDNYEKTVTNLLINKHGITAEEFMANTVNAIRKNPELLKCTTKSLFGAILLSAECGLNFNTPMEHAYLIPSKNKGVYEVRFQIGYQGLVEIMYRNPKVAKIVGIPVYKNDEFDYGYGLEPYLIHKPSRGENRGALDCVYAIVKLKDSNESIFTVVEKEELTKIKNLSPAKESKFSPYNSGTDVHNWMQVKVAIKKISKLIPKTPEIKNIINIDDKISSRYKANAEILNNPNDIASVIFTEESIFGSAFDDYEEIPTENETPPVNEKVNNTESKTPPVKKEEVKKDVKYGVSVSDIEDISNDLELGKEKTENTPNANLFEDE
jgi:recombination protein RecT